MKIILISLISIHLLTLNSIATELKECSVFNKLSSKYLKCKTGKFIKDTKDYQNKEWSEEKSKIKKIIKKVKKNEFQ
ncbi:hypothetical protein N8Z31_02185 [Pelagibacteraceae bacterium]|jgi:hypothetical protein|nr:hypothetical protein [Pelagibacteraceae bacterium]|tara:strand:- start:582 stop:812 length:231 start_codon:yes stop_codon:yes gene_type:complete